MLLDKRVKDLFAKGDLDDLEDAHYTAKAAKHVGSGSTFGRSGKATHKVS